jgi:hypothetical protein
MNEGAVHGGHVGGTTDAGGRRRANGRHFLVTGGSPGWCAGRTTRVAPGPRSGGAAGAGAALASGALDAADHGPRRERDHVAGGERDLHDAVGPRLDHEHAAADRAPGRATMIVARPGVSAEAGMMRGVVMGHPQLGVKVPWPAGSIVPARWCRRSTTSETCARSRSRFAGACSGGGIVSVHCSPCTGQAA